MTEPLPDLSEFRLEFRDNGLVHIVFDAPGRSMNVFSNAAIADIGAIARWLAEANVRGALIRSGKESGFCAGADLPEIWAGYEMVTATAPTRRFNIAFDHFFLQPMDSPARDANTQAATRYCLEHPQWRLSLQTHKLIGIR